MHINVINVNCCQCVLPPLLCAGAVVNVKSVATVSLDAVELSIGDADQVSLLLRKTCRL